MTTIPLAQVLIEGRRCREIKDSKEGKHEENNRVRGEEIKENKIKEKKRK
ncbi:hypothetical protein AB4Z22_29840 [Paenibacillus sp. TAF58]